MPILKNESIYPFKEADYCKPRHIIVEGTYEEIGYDLGTLAKNEYGVKFVSTWPATGRRCWNGRRACFAPLTCRRMT
jgi:hypothetical protein